MRATTRIALLASVALASPAFAAVPAAEAAATAADVEAITEDAEIVVFGKGEVRQVTEI